MKKKWFRALVGACAIANLGFIAGCATDFSPATNKDPTVLYHNNWWNFYERGNYYLSQDDLEEAMKDFETALGIRPGAKFGYPQDQWRARTYGLHFTEAYFPHRELGVSLYLLGQNDKAITYLKKSLDQEPTGRAKHYLNLAQAKAFEARTLRPPRIDLEQASRVRWSKERTRTIEGWARGEGLIRDVRINGKREFIELAETERPFSQTVKLNEGDNRIVIEVEDLAGQRVRQALTWTADWQPPAMVIKRATKQGHTWVIEGVLVDDRALATATVRGASQNRDLDIGADTRSASLQITLDQGEAVKLIAEDRAGNRIETELSHDDLNRQEAQLRTRRHAEATPKMMHDGAPPHQEGATRQAPRLAVDNADVTTVYDDEWILSGRASAAQGLSALSINGENIIPGGYEGTLSYAFTRRVALDEGTNTVHIIARDMQGDESSQTLYAIRKQPSYLDKRYRLSLVMLPAESKEEIDKAYVVERVMERELLRDPVRFYLLERREGWEAIMREHVLSVSDVADPKAALAIGRLLPADMLLMPMLVKHGDGLTVFGAIMDAETGEALVTEDVYLPFQGGDASYQVAGLILKLEQAFPVWSGRVASTSRKNAALSVDEASKVRNQTRFIVLRPAAASSTIEESIVQRVDGQLIELVVEDVESGQLHTRAVPSEAARMIEEGDYVYAR